MLPVRCYNSSLSNLIRIDFVQTNWLSVINTGTTYRSTHLLEPTTAKLRVRLEWWSIFTVRLHVMQRTVGPIAVAILSDRLSVCPSVRRVYIVTKLNDALRIFWYHTKRQSQAADTLVGILKRVIFTPAVYLRFLEFLQSTGRTLSRPPLRQPNDVMSEIECAQLHSELFTRRHSTRQSHGLFVLAKHLFTLDCYSHKHLSHTCYFNLACTDQLIAHQNYRSVWHTLPVKSPAKWTYKEGVNFQASWASQPMGCLLNVLLGLWGTELEVGVSIALSEEKCFSIIDFKIMIKIINLLTYLLTIGQTSELATWPSISF